MRDLSSGEFGKFKHRDLHFANGFCSRVKRLHNGYIILTANIRMIFEVMVRKNIIPLRGVGEDWSGDNEKKQLRKNQIYARLFIENQLLGSPDFNEYESFLCLPKRKVTKTTKHRRGTKSKK